jgi:hypothetical protein
MRVLADSLFYGDRHRMRIIEPKLAICFRVEEVVRIRGKKSERKSD